MDEILNILFFLLKMKVLAGSPGVQVGLSRGDGAPPSRCHRPGQALQLALAWSLP